MPLGSCEMNSKLTWPANFVIPNSAGVVTFAITDTKLYILVVTLLTQDNARLLQR